MRIRFLLAVLALGLAGLVSAQRPHPNNETLQKQAVAWLKTNNAFGPDHDLVGDLGSGVEKALKQGKDFTVILGPKLTKSGKATALASHGDEVVALELTAEQIKKTTVRADGAAIIEGAKCQDIVQSPFPFQIEKPKFTGGLVVDGSKEFKGEVMIERKEQIAGKLSVRLTLTGEGLANTLYFPIERQPLADKASITFTFPPVNAKGKKGFRGPAVAFIDLCIVDSNKPEAMVLSNAKAVVLEVK